MPDGGSGGLEGTGPAGRGGLIGELGTGANWDGTRFCVSVRLIAGGGVGGGMPFGTLDGGGAFGTLAGGGVGG